MREVIPRVIPIISIVVGIVVVAGLLRWLAVRRRPKHNLPPLFFPLGRDGQAYGARPSWHNTTPVPNPSVVQPSTNMYGSPSANTHSQMQSPVHNVTPVTSTPIAPQVVEPQLRPNIAATNNGASISAINTPNNGVNLSASNGTASAHVVNGRTGPSHIVPPSGSRTPPPPLITPTHLKVVRDLPDFANEHEPAPAETVRFRRPTDEAVHLLPGRLEFLSGVPRHQEIRFVRIPGRPAELILGREPGDTPQHVALRSSTVSRQHARFVYVNGQWHVVNLSNTNPVVVNGEELMAYDAARGLTDGDRVELGEVVMRFRSH